MTGDNFQGQTIDESIMESLLRHTGYGVLSLAREGMAYGIPISFGYDDDVIYFIFFRFQSGQSQKLEWIQHTTTGSLLVFEIVDEDDWWSVVARGSVRMTESREEWEQLVDVMDDNAWRPSILNDAGESSGVEGYRMAVSELEGRCGRDTQFDVES